MTTQSSNIELRGTDIPDRLRMLREERHLSQNDLAEKAGLTYRTVHDLEAGRRDRVLEKTMMLLATALDVPLRRLVSGEASISLDTPTVRGRRWPWLVVAVLVVSIAAAGAYIWHRATAQAEWELEGNILTARDAYFGIPLWSYKTDEKIECVDVAPWGTSDLLMGLGPRSPEGGRLLCLDRASGRQRWEAEPDRGPIVGAFGEEVVSAGNFTCLRLVPVDLDGDGVMEIAASFRHVPYYPTAICLFDRHGHRLRQYATKGWVFDMTVTDLDRDGAKELIVSGTNNAPTIQGAMLVMLDWNHFMGATVDSLCDCPGGLPDSSRIRFVLPAFPAPHMAVLEDMRLTAWQPRVFSSLTGESQFSFDTGSWLDPHHRLIVTLDANLRPISTVISDAFNAHIASSWPDSLKGENGPMGEDWRRHWLDTYLRYEVGRYIR